MHLKKLDKEYGNKPKGLSYTDGKVNSQRIVSDGGRAVRECVYADL